MRALLSVANREGISAFARRTRRPGLRAVRHDGTREHLAADGVEAASVSDLTAVPPLVGGQVRTFHPAIYAGILARRDIPAQLEQLAEHGIGLIDVVVVNVKPFAPEVGRQHIGIDEAIEMIDVGGTALLSAAARNHAGVAAVPPGSPRSCSKPALARPGAATRGNGWRGCLQHGRRYYARSAYLNQTPATSIHSGGPGCEKSPTCLRREPPARRVLPGDDAQVGVAGGREPGPRRTADVQHPAGHRRRLADRDGLHNAHGRDHQAHRSGGARDLGRAGRGVSQGARDGPGRVVRRHRGATASWTGDRARIAANSTRRRRPGVLQARWASSRQAGAGLLACPRRQRGHARLRIANWTSSRRGGQWRGARCRRPRPGRLQV